MADDDLLAAQHEGRRRFLELVADLRPELHRYCARMTGSVADGEDIVQDTLARAYYLLPEMNELPAFRPWLFRIAHNRALDHLRRYEARMVEPLEAVRDTAVDPAPDPGDAIAHRAGGASGGVALRRIGAGAAQLRHPKGRAGPFARGDRRAAGTEPARR